MQKISSAKSPSRGGNTQKSRRLDRRVRSILHIAVLVSGVAWPIVASAQTWNTNGNGNWNTAGNWTPSTVPTGIGASATLGNVITAPRTVTLNVPITLGTLSLNGTNAYTLGGPNALTFDASVGSATISVVGTAAHTLSVPLSLTDTLAVSNSSSGALTLSGVISGAGALIKSGTGTLNLNAANTYTGGTSINNGTVSYGAASAIPNASAVTIGDGVGAADSARLNINISMLPAQALIVTMGSDGLLAQGNNRLVRLGSVAGSGELRLNSAVGNGFEITGAGDATYSGVITGGISLDSGDPNAGERLSKSGAGTQTLAGTNIHVGRTFINGGALRVTNNAALGTTSSGRSNATFVYGSGALELSGNRTIAERLYLNGSGTASGGALRSVSGNSTITSNISIGWAATGVVAANAAIGVDSGSTLTINGVVSGGTALNKVGAGTLVLNSVGAWTGGTVFTGGIFRLGVATAVPTASALTFAGGTFDLNNFSRTINTLTGTGGLTLGSAVLTVNQAAAGTFTGPVTGTGSLTKTGAGTLTLVGTNTYSGGTTVSAGTLQGDSASLQGNILNNAALVFDQSIAGSFAGLVSGTGSLTKTGVGVLTLTGANSYSGGTTVSAGTLQGSTTSLQGNILNNGALVFDQSIAGSFAGLVSGTGSLTKTGAGMLTLTGANTYSGGTTVSAGTLQGSTTSLQGNIVNNVALVFDQSIVGSFAGLVSGTGSLTKTGAGVLTLTGANSYSGGTTVSAGTLQGNTTSLQGNIANASAIVFDQNFDGTYASAISGTGGVATTGTGEVRFTGANTYTGGTTLAAGTLSVDGSVTGGLAVLTGATLAGTGSAGAVTVQSGGTISPGNSIGTLTLATLAQSGIYALEYRAPDPGSYAFLPIGSGQSIRGRNSLSDPLLPPGSQDADLIRVTGGATLAAGSTVALTRLGTEASIAEALAATGNTNRELRYLILRAENGVSGQYVALSESRSQLEYLDSGAGPGVEDVWLVLRGVDTPVITNTAPTPFMLALPGDQPRCDLESLNQQSRRCVFVQGSYAALGLEADDVSPGTDVDATSGIIGGGVQVSDGLWLGLALGQGGGDLDLSDASASADTDRLTGTLWGNWISGPVELRGWAGFGQYDVNAQRQTSTGDFAFADYDANGSFLAVELRRWQDMRPGTSVTPLLGLGAAQIDTDAYRETGGGIENFAADAQSQWSLRSLIGVEARWRPEGPAAPLAIDASLGWNHEFGDTSASLSGIYEGDVTGTTLSSTSPAYDRNQIAAGVGATFALNSGSTLRLEYDLGYSNEALTQAASARWSMAF